MSERVAEIRRFNLAQRVEHFILILSFTILGLTGLPQKYPLSPISQAIVDLLGGIDSIRIIHRVAATVFLIEGVYHLIFLGYHFYVERRRATMLPTIKDGQDALDALKYNVGLSNKHPHMPRYNFTEKMEYLAMAWGFFLMGLTGFMLWNPIATAKLLPGVVIPAAKLAHGAEAVLAVVAILLWHFYHVHIRRFNKSMFTGTMSREAMEEEHAAELEAIERGQTHKPVREQERRKRLTVFTPIALVLAAVLLFGVIRFITFEETAIVTVLPGSEGSENAFQPWTPTVAEPSPTLAPTSEAATPVPLTWEAGINQAFATRCGACHGELGGFTAETYEGVMQAVTPGDPDNSLVIQVQQDSHPGMFEPDELELIQSWIAEGAPEQ